MTDPTMPPDPHEPTLRFGQPDYYSQSDPGPGYPEQQPYASPYAPQTYPQASYGQQHPYPLQPYGPQGYQAQQYPPYPVTPPTSGKATAALAFGIGGLLLIWLYGVGGLLCGIPALIFAHQAKVEIERSQGQLGGSGVATAGFVMGLISTIIGGLGALVVIGILIFAAGAIGVLGLG